MADGKRPVFQMRLTDEDKELLDALEKIYGEKNRSKIVRAALEHIREKKPTLKLEEILSPQQSAAPFTN